MMYTLCNYAVVYDIFPISYAVIVILGWCVPW